MRDSPRVSVIITTFNRAMLLPRERYLKLFSAKAVLPALLSTYMRVAASHGSHLTPMRNDALAHPWEIAAEF